MGARQIEIATASPDGHAWRQRFTAEQYSSRDDFKSFQEILDDGEVSLLELPEFIENVYQSALTGRRRFHLLFNYQFAETIAFYDYMIHHLSPEKRGEKENVVSSFNIHSVRN